MYDCDTVTIDDNNTTANMDRLSFFPYPLITKQWDTEETNTLHIQKGEVWGPEQIP